MFCFSIYDIIFVMKKIFNIFFVFLNIFITSNMFLVSLAHAELSSVPSETWTTNGTVNSIVVGEDGTTYVGGYFTYVGPNTGSGASVDTNTGEADTGFPKVEGGIRSVISDGEGGWYIGGYFNKVGGLSRNNLAHIFI